MMIKMLSSTTSPAARVPSVVERGAIVIPSMTPFITSNLGQRANKCSSSDTQHPASLLNRKTDGVKRKNQKKTYNSGDSPVVTHLTTNPPVSSLNIAEQTRDIVFWSLWSYVLFMPAILCQISGEREGATGAEEEKGQVRPEQTNKGKVQRDGYLRRKVIAV